MRISDWSSDVCSSDLRVRFHGLDYAPVADFGLLKAAWEAADQRDDVTAWTGLIFSSDQFYSSRPELMEPMVEHGALAVEMEASALYPLAALPDRCALAICTLSDPLVPREPPHSPQLNTPPRS